MKLPVSAPRRALCAAAMYAAATLAVRLGLGAALRALFQAWNLNADTAARAPSWARALYAWHGSALTALSCAAVAALCIKVFRAKIPRPAWKPAARWWLIGAAMALGSAAVFLLADSLRPQWPLTRPHLSAALPALWLLSLLTAAAEEIFTKAVLLETLGPRRGTLWAAAAFFLINGGPLSGSPVAALNVALMGALCCLLYTRFGLWPDVAFRWGWSFAAVFLLGQGGGSHSVYKLYAVSEALLTGGDRGFAYGLWLTLLLAAAIARLIWQGRCKTGRRHRSSSFRSGGMSSP